MTAPAIDIIRAIDDENILGDTLSLAQRSALKVLYGLPLSRDESAIAAKCMGRTPETQEFREAAFVCGRRSGKSDKLCANIAVYEALLRPHRLSPGETGTVLVLAQNMRQAQVVSGYVRGKLERSPILRQHVLSSKTLEIELTNRVVIAIHPASFKAIRGLSVVACICDEIGFWWSEEYSNPDTEVIRAVRPAMATFPNAKLILASSPYSKSGALYEWWQRRHEDPDVLVWHSDTATMNPTIRASFLEREKARDPESFAREYQAVFVDSISAFLPADAIEACVTRGRTGVGFSDRVTYVAAIDSAYRGDAFTICVGHREGERVVVDHLSGWKGSRGSPLRLGDLLPRIRAICDRYRISRIYGDQFGSEPLRFGFESVGLAFQEVTFSVATKADLFGNLRALIVDGRIELLDHDESVKELRGLEVELLPGGSMRVGHAHRASAHDDYATVIALVAAEAVRCGSGGSLEPSRIVARACGEMSAAYAGRNGSEDDDEEYETGADWEAVDVRPWMR